MGRLFFIGDIHGQIHPINRLARYVEGGLDYDDGVVLLGDSGLNFCQNWNDTWLKRQLNKLPCTFYVLRGNHDHRVKPLVEAAPDEWISTHENNEGLIQGWFYTEKEYPNIKYFVDNVDTYAIYHNDSFYKVLVIPGAYSVDKYYRLKNGWKWYEDEQLTPWERQEGLVIAKNQSAPFDFVLSHTCPAIFEPTDLFLPFIDQSTVDKTMEMYLGELEYTISYNFWLWGHFHEFRVYPGPPRNAGQCIMLDAGESVLELDRILKGDYTPIQKGENYVK